MVTAATRRRDAILATCRALEAEGVPDDVLSPVVEFAGTLVCEECGERATSGPHGPDGLYFCGNCPTEETNS